MQRSTPRPIAIKRVLRQGAAFTCGICRRRHTTERAATGCLERCLNAYVAQAGTVAAEPSAAGAPKRFRCGFCKRVYPSKPAAQDCASACKASTQKSIEVERSVRPQELSAPAVAAAAPAPVKEKKKAVVRRDQGHKFLRDGRKLVCRKCGKESKTLDEVIACYDGHPAKEKKPKAEKPPLKVVKAPKVAKPAPAPVVAAEPVAAAPVAEPVVAAAPAAPKVVAPDDDHKFRRDGARYVCRSCSKKFFTRGDVVQCFDSHAAA